MTKIKTSNDYKDFMNGFLTRDDVGQVSPPDSFDVVVKNQGRWKSYRFVYESETKWCTSPDQVDVILKKNRHTPDKPYMDARKVMTYQNGQTMQADFPEGQNMPDNGGIEGCSLSLDVAKPISERIQGLNSAIREDKRMVRTGL